MRIAKAGANEVRRHFVQCALRSLGPFGKDSDLRRWGRCPTEDVMRQLEDEVPQAPTCQLPSRADAARMRDVVAEVVGRRVLAHGVTNELTMDLVRCTKFASESGQAVQVGTRRDASNRSGDRAEGPGVRFDLLSRRQRSRPLRLLQ